MLALIIPVLNSVLGGIIKPFVAAWTDYERTKLTTGEAGFAAAAAADSAVMQAAALGTFILPMITGIVIYVLTKSQ
ncbi:MAG: hypothetical protein ACR2KT_08725 [Methylocella sp.]|nr:MAG: hypothetical protein DLM68_06120 [Hyphomicrobiales bacterium]